MRHHSAQVKFDSGLTVRVVMVSDVIALPDYNWSIGGVVGQQLDEDYLLQFGRLPGTEQVRELLVHSILTAIREADKDSVSSRRALRVQA